MKRVLAYIFVLLICILVFSFKVCAVSQSNRALEETEEKLFSLVDDETLEVLEELGIDGLDLKNINNISFKNIITYFSDDFITQFRDTLKHSFLILSVIFLMSLITLPSQSADNDIIEFLTVLIVIVITVSRFSDIINVSLSVIRASTNFLLAYIPIFAVLIAVSGNAATALSYNTFLIGVSQAFSGFLSLFARKILGVYFALAIGFSLNNNVSLNRFVSSFSKTASLLIGFISSLFASFLTVKSVFSVNIDTVSAKGIRFMLSSSIPVVGSAISDAYSTLLGSIGVVKSSAAIVAVAVSLIINLPVLFKGLCFCISFNFLSFTAEILNSRRAADILRAFSVGVKFLLLIQVFVMFILVISTAVMVSIKTSV